MLAKPYTVRGPVLAKSPSHPKPLLADSIHSKSHGPAYRDMSFSASYGVKEDKAPQGLYYLKGTHAAAGGQRQLNCTKLRQKAEQGSSLRRADKHAPYQTKWRIPRNQMVRSKTLQTADRLTEVNKLDAFVAEHGKRNLLLTNLNATLGVVHVMISTVPVKASNRRGLQLLQELIGRLAACEQCLRTNIAHVDKLAPGEAPVQPAVGSAPEASKALARMMLNISGLSPSLDKKVVAIKKELEGYCLQVDSWKLHVGALASVVPLMADFIRGADQFLSFCDVIHPLAQQKERAAERWEMNPQKTINVPPRKPDGKYEVVHHSHTYNHLTHKMHTREQHDEREQEWAQEKEDKVKGEWAQELEREKTKPKRPWDGITPPGFAN